MKDAMFFGYWTLGPKTGLGQWSGKGHGPNFIQLD